MMERVLGPMPKDLIRKSSAEAQQYFLPNGSVKWPNSTTDSAGVRKVKKMTNLEVILINLNNLKLLIVVVVLLLFWVSFLLTCCN